MKIKTIFTDERVATVAHKLEDPILDVDLEIDPRRRNGSSTCSAPGRK